MFHIYRWDKPKYGFNFFPLSDKTSIGFILKVTQKLQFYVRYSKVTGIWYFEKNIVPSKFEEMLEVIDMISSDPIKDNYEDLKNQANKWQFRCDILLDRGDVRWKTNQ